MVQSILMLVVNWDQQSAPCYRRFTSRKTARYPLNVKIRGFRGQLTFSAK